MQGLQNSQGFAKVSHQLQPAPKASKRDSFRVTGTQATSTTLKTLDPEKIQHIDYVVFDKLTYIINKYSLRYDGFPHASWSKSLFFFYKEKIPTEKIEEYIAPLTKQIETIEHWNIENVLITFSFMSRVGFFNQLPNLTRHKEGTISLRNKFLCQIDEQLHKIPINKKNAISYICLLKSVLDQINYDKSISPISEKLLNQVYSSLMETQELLSPYHYKEILQTITEIGNRIKKYVPMFKLLIYKHLDSIVNTKIDADNELNFVVYFSGICNLISQNFPVEGENKKNFIELINKIKFTRDSEMAVLGLKSIATLVDKEKISLELVENKINECINFIYEKNLELYQISKVIVAISKYLNALNSLPDNLKQMIDKYLTVLLKNKDALPSETLRAILKTLRSLVCFDYPVSPILKEISEVMEKSKIEFLNSSPTEIHGTITNLAKVLAHTKKDFNDHLVLNFTNFLTALMPKYLEIIIDTPLSEMVNSFITLSSLIDSGYLANTNMKITFNTLLSKIDGEIHSLTQKQLINFLRVICLNYNLFTLKDKKITEYAEKLLEFSATKSKIQALSVRLKSITLWCMLIFYELNNKKFNDNLLHRFRNAIISLYQALDSDKKSNEITTPQSTGYVFAANWLGYKINEPFAQGAIELNNDVQTKCLRILQAKFSELHFEEEQSINGLPPCDIVVHDKKLAIEVQGMYHFLDKDRTLMNGTTFLKNALLRKNDYHVIEIKVIDGKILDSEIKACFNKIEKILERTQSLQKIKF